VADRELLMVEVLQQFETIKDRCQRHGFFGTQPNYLDMRDIEDMAAKGIEKVLQLMPDAAGSAVDGVLGTYDRDRLLRALERAAAAESALRALVDECDNDSTVGWEDRMKRCIDHANQLLASAAGVALDHKASDETRNKGGA
jgi:hypothetical protein